MQPDHFVPSSVHLSPFERFLERSRYGDAGKDSSGLYGNLCRTLQAAFLVSDLLNLRYASHAVRLWVDAGPSGPFRTLTFLPAFFSQHYRWDVHLQGLRTIGHYCTELVVKVDHGYNGVASASNHGIHQRALDQDRDSQMSTSLASGMHTHTGSRSGRRWSLHRRSRTNDTTNSSPMISSASPGSQASHSLPNLQASMPELWRNILGRLPNMTSLTFRLPGAGRPATVSSPSFHTLLSLRLALESRPSFHSSLSRLRLEPIPLTYLPALRFAGGAAYTRADWMTGRVWSTLRILVIHLTPPQRPLPGGHSEDAKVGGKVLHDYLSSFSETLEELSVHWIGSCGANVLFLEESTGWDGGRDFSAPQLTWRRLKRLLLGGMGITVDQVRRLFTERATELRSLRIERGILADGVEEAYNKLAMAALSWRTYREGDTYTTEVWSNESFNQRKSDRGGWEGQGDGDANVGYIPIILQYASF